MGGSFLFLHALQRDEATFSHANQVKNMLGQFGVAAACLSLVLLARLVRGALTRRAAVSSRAAPR